MKRFFKLALLLLLLLPSGNLFPENRSLLAPLSISQFPSGENIQERLWKIPAHLIFPAGKSLSYDEILERLSVQLQLKNSAFSPEDIKRWLTHLIVERKIARLFRVEGQKGSSKKNQQKKIKIQFCLLDYDFWVQEPKPAFFAQDEVNQYLGVDSPAETGYLEDVKGVLGFVMNNELGSISPKKVAHRTTESHRFRARIVNLLHEAPQHDKQGRAQLRDENPEAYEAILKISSHWIQKLEETPKNNKVLIKTIHRTFRVAHQMTTIRKEDLEAILAVFCVELSDKECKDLLSDDFYNKVTYFRKTMAKMESLPFNPVKEKGHVLQNYFHAIRQISFDSYGEQNLGIQLAFLTHRVESLKDLETPRKRATEEETQKEKESFRNRIEYGKNILLHQIASKSGLGSLKARLEDVLFQKEFPNLHSLLQEAIREHTGIAYDLLPWFLRGPVLAEIKQSLHDLEQSSEFEYHSRVKTLYACWKKISGKLNLEKSSMKRLESDLSQDSKGSLKTKWRSKIAKVLGSAGSRDDSVWDLLGGKVLFALPEGLREEAQGKESEFLLEQQGTIMKILKEKYPPLEEASKNIAKHGFSEQKAILMVEVRGSPVIVEFQAMSRRDGALNTHGGALNSRGDDVAHWVFDLNSPKPHKEKTEYQFDIWVMKKLNRYFQNDYSKDEELIFKEMRPFVHPVVLKPGEKPGEWKTLYLQLPTGSLSADLAATSSVNAFNSQYKGAWEVELKDGKIVKSSPVPEGSPLEDGKIYYFGDLPGKEPRPSVFASGKDLETRLKKMTEAIEISPRAVTWAKFYHLSNKSKDSSEETLSVKGKAILQKFLDESEVLNPNANEEKTTTVTFAREGRFLHLGGDNDVYFLIALLDEPGILTETQKKNVVSMVARDFYRDQLKRPFPAKTINIEDISLEDILSDLKLNPQTSPTDLLLRIMETRIQGEHLFDSDPRLLQMKWRIDLLAEDLGFASKEGLYRALAMGTVTVSTLFLRLTQMEELFKMTLSSPDSVNSPGLLNRVGQGLEMLGIPYRIFGGDWTLPVDAGGDSMVLPVLLQKDIPPTALQEMSVQLLESAGLPESTGSVIWKPVGVEKIVNLNLSEALFRSAHQVGFQHALLEILEEWGLNIKSINKGRFLTLKLRTIPEHFDVGHFRSLLLREVAARVHLSEKEIQKFMTVSGKKVKPQAQEFLMAA